LIGILLSFIFSFFKDTLIQKGQTLLLKEKTMRFELLRLRLEQLFNNYSEEKESALLSFAHADAVGPALLIYCEHGLHPDPSYSGLIYSMLFKTRDHRLCLCTWSKNNTPKVDTVLDKVEDLCFSFFAEKEWHSAWPLDEKSALFPCMIKISVLMQEEKEMQKKKETRRDLVFSLPPYAKIQYNEKTVNPLEKKLP
jgi:hypothetical protein